METVKRSEVARGLEEGGMNRQSAGGGGHEAILFDTMMVNTCHCTFAP